MLKWGRISEIVSQFNHLATLSRRFAKKMLSGAGFTRSDSTQKIIKTIPQHQFQRTCFLIIDQLALRRTIFEEAVLWGALSEL